MKHLIGTAILVLSLCALNAAMSCSLTGENGVSTTGIAAPTVQASGESILVNSAPIKDESFLSAITYANIFRRHADDEAGSNASDWQNIGQVSCASADSTFREFGFTDDNVYNGYYYSYRVRYYNGSYYVHSGNSAWVQNTKGTGTQNIMDDATVYYYRNDATGEYTVELTEPAAGFSGINNNFDSLCLLLHNKTTAKPFELAAVTVADDSVENSGTVAIGDTLREMHKILPPSFLDVDLTPQGLVLFHNWSDAAQSLNYYCWTEPKEVSLAVWQIDSLGDDVFGTGRDTPETTVTSFVVPSIPEPENPFDASSLSVSAKALAAPAFADSAATPAADSASSAAISLDFTPLSED